MPNPRAWLFHVLRNHLLDQLKSYGARNEVAIKGVEHLADCRQNAEQQYHSAETARNLARLLSPREWECVRLRAEGLSYKEVAEIMDLRKGTVGATLTRAHRKFRRALGRGEELRESAVQKVYAALRKEDSHSSRSGNTSGVPAWSTDR